MRYFWTSLPTGDCGNKAWLVYGLPVEPHPSCRVSRGDFYSRNHLCWSASGFYLLFILHINDLPEVLSDCNILMYADDTFLCCSSSQASVIQDKLNTEQLIACLLMYQKLKLCSSEPLLDYLPLIVGRRNARQLVYCSLIRPILEYRISVRVCCREGHKHGLETLQTGLLG